MNCLVKVRSICFPYLMLIWYWAYKFIVVITPSWHRQETKRKAGCLTQKHTSCSVIPPLKYLTLGSWAVIKHSLMPLFLKKTVILDPCQALIEDRLTLWTIVFFKPCTKALMKRLPTKTPINNMAVMMSSSLSLYSYLWNTNPSHKFHILGGEYDRPDEGAF